MCYEKCLLVSCCGLFSLGLFSVYHEIQYIDGCLISTATIDATSSCNLFTELEHVDSNICLLAIDTSYFKKFIHEKCKDTQTVWQKFCRSLEHFKKLKYLSIRLSSFNGLIRADIQPLERAIRFIKPGISIIITIETEHKTKITINPETYKFLACALTRCNFYNYREELWYKDIEMQERDTELTHFDKPDENAF